MSDRTPAMTQHRAHILLALHCRSCCKAQFYCPFCGAGLEFHADKKLGPRLEVDNTLQHTCRYCGGEITATTRGFLDNRTGEARVLNSDSSGLIGPLEQSLALPAAIRPPRRRFWPFG